MQCILVQILQLSIETAQPGSKIMVDHEIEMRPLFNNRRLAYTDSLKSWLKINVKQHYPGKSG